MSGWITATTGLVEKPDPPFGVIDECFEEARGRHVIVFVTEIVGLAQGRDHTLVVLTEFGQHVLRIDIGGVIVGQALMTRDIADGSQCRSAEFAYPFCEYVGGGKYLIGVLVEQQ